jgi:hypothetical protein
VTICPAVIYGFSTGQAPSQVNNIIIKTKDQNMILFKNINIVELIFREGRVNRANRIIIEKANAITPPSLFGIDRKIEYANNKYHSG